MNVDDQKIINLINELLLEKSTDKVKLKMHELFDLVATSSSPIDIEKLNALRDLKAAFENIEENDFASFLSALNFLKDLY